jgi:hypothetical protein
LAVDRFFVAVGHYKPRPHLNPKSPAMQKIALVAVALLAVSVHAVASDKIMMSVGCKADCSSCASSVELTHNTGREYCTASSMTNGNATGFRCIAAAHTCVDVMAYSDSGCATLNSTDSAVCNQCMPFSGTTMMQIKCENGVAGATVNTCNSDCSTCTKLLDVSACTSTGTDYIMAGSGRHCNVFGVAMHMGACDQPDQMLMKSEQGVCSGSGDQKVKVECGGNAGSASAVSALVAVLAVVMTIVA